MIDDTMHKIQVLLKEHGDHLSQAQRDELEGLYAQLKVELTELEKTDKVQAHKIAEQTHHATQEALRKDKAHATSHHESMHELRDATRKFEATHPGLMGVVMSICNAFGV